MLTLSGYASYASAQIATRFGETVVLGKGTAHTYVELNPDGSPVRLGITFTKNALEGLPTKPNNTGRCFDVNGNGVFDAHGECLGDYEWVLTLPKELAKRPEISFQWVGINWSPEGHVPPAPPACAVPHFDFHFYRMSREAIQRIRPGTCGELIDCEDFQRATRAVPAQYLPKQHIDVGAAVPAMGNHLIDTTTPELGNPPQPFTHTFIYGSYDGQIAFYEPMITRAYLLTQPEVCRSLHLPQAWDTSGYYPTMYCIRYHESRTEYTVSLDNFVYREAK
jgi:hypothetical protein